MAEDHAAVSSAAAALVIGDEILSGAITDTNTPWLARMLNSQGVDMVRFEYVPDDAQVIGQALERLKGVVGDSGVIFTSGGIGPTHDDVTYEAIANTFGVECVVHDPTLERMHAHYEARGLEVNSARRRMATLPVGARVHFTEGLDPAWVPLVEIDGVFVLPGIPRLFQAMVSGQKDRFVGQQYEKQELFTTKGEGDIADALRAVAAQHPKVHIGSYPNVDPLEQSRFTVKIVATSRESSKLSDAVASLQPVLV